jgi:riboflavin synthase
MFTGIVEEIGTVKEVAPGRLGIKAQVVLGGTRIGDSISVNGACLTVTSIEKDNFSVDIMPETSRRTSTGRLHYGDKVNLERAMPADGRFGGHFVQGHVDGNGKVISVKPEGEALIVLISAPADIMRYIVKKGFIAVDGISLTVVDCDNLSFSVSVVSFTRNKTTLGVKRPGEMVNLEVDIIAKYVERMKIRGNQGLIDGWINEYDSLKTG